ncbi:MAG: DUF364 domain-containing protein [Desulfobacula sp.]|uniref:Rossmann-like domain-containing protein n=1 Tax=Desulfobacula sp. TaxID=2593537 RepID=UPI0025C331B8|nr:DUF364 domain-containing protein [Desulfobacula sp.]MCD4718613.1 DUF364 domain-containing protein [Desulfobacula sp.]
MSKRTCPEPVTPVLDRPLEGAEKKLVIQMISSIIRPDTIVEQVVAGPKFMAVVAGGRMGLSSMLGAKPKQGEIDLLDKVIGRPVKEAANYIRQSSPFAISLGFAALNAGNTPEPGSVEPSDFPADELIAGLGKDKITGLVGEFPFVKHLGERVGILHLFELRRVPGAVPEDQWETVLARLDVLALTGTALLTRHMAWYLSRAHQAKIVILGPTTPVSPILFEYGANFLCGSVVTDMEKVAGGIRAGISFSEIKKNGGVIFTQWEKKDLLND